VSINFPGTISSVKGGTWTGSTANFDLGLADILSLEKSFSYEVNWTPFR
jgi:hypothetical protein